MSETREGRLMANESKTRRGLMVRHTAKAPAAEPAATAPASVPGFDDDDGDEDLETMKRGLRRGLFQSQRGGC